MIISSAFDAAETVRLVDEHHISYFSATDDMVMAMLAADPRPKAMPGLTAIGFGAFNASPEELAERAAARGVCLVGLYGMSEVMALYARRSADDPPEARIQGGGKLISPDAEVRVREPDSGILCAHGEKGELEIRGPSLMTGYFENEAATSAAFTEDGFLKTGDLGFTTSQSEFTYVTRMGDTLRLGGFLVSPVEIEAHLAEHETVAGAQVVSVRVGDATRAYAFIVGARRHEVSAMTLDSHCRASLARFKVPIAFHVLDAFPKTKGANGTKIQRARLREIAQTAVDRGGNQ
jgi:fatty-acyl-CoA synthase